jgi:hypothetical protein
MQPAAAALDYDYSHICFLSHPFDNIANQQIAEQWLVGGPRHDQIILRFRAGPLGKTQDRFKHVHAFDDLRIDERVINALG